jgi:hypothetical protein
MPTVQAVRQSERCGISNGYESEPSVVPGRISRLPAKFTGRDLAKPR